MSYITISTGNRTFSIAGSEDCVERIFNNIVGELSTSSLKGFTVDEPQDSDEELHQEVSESVPAVENHSDISGESSKSVDSLEDEEAEVSKPVDRDTRKVQFSKDSPGFYRGFLYMKCEHCGEIKGFNSRYDIDTYTCNACGKPTFMFDMIPMTAVCECGKRWRYMTNMKEDNFEINCLTCGYPIPVYFNSRKNKYETLFEGEKRLNHKKKGKGKK